MNHEEWASHLSCELGYWNSMASGEFHNKDWVRGFHDRVANRQAFPSHLLPYLDKPRLADLRILDVGAGPCTVLGRTVDGVRLNIKAVDPLSESYMAMFRDNHLTPEIKTEFGEAEHLDQIFAPNYFDFVYSRNALDHAYNPWEGIQKMIDVCAMNGTVFFENVINDGLNEKYLGLHRWNFMPASDDLVIWGRNGVAELASKKLRGFNRLTAFMIRSGWVGCEIKKA